MCGPIKLACVCGTARNLRPKPSSTSQIRARANISAFRPNICIQPTQECICQPELDSQAIGHNQSIKHEFAFGHHIRQTDLIHVPRQQAPSECLHASELLARIGLQCRFGRWHWTIMLSCDTCKGQDTQAKGVVLHVRVRAVTKAIRHTIWPAIGGTSHL